ncbi:MAG: hypothetical protein LBJ25_01155 [Candidatus Margulisbacteria bacterium]|jgi:hypothetical protein|nr:hypothetical protein [Candidatus Margulisiibacteriota bacterium]
MGRIWHARIAAGEEIRAADMLNLTFFPLGTILIYDGGGWTDNVTLQGWYLCDGQEKTLPDGKKTTTPDLINKFVRGGTSCAAGGDGKVTLTVQNMPSHGHGLTGLSVDSGGAHTHTGSGMTVSEKEDHTHGFSATSSLAGEHNHYFPVTGGDDNNHSGTQGNGAADTDAGFHDDSYTRDAGAHTHTVSGSVSYGGAHTHTVSGNTDSGGGHTHTTSGGTVDYVGGGEPFEVMPAYYTLIYIKRCA